MHQRPSPVADLQTLADRFGIQRSDLERELAEAAARWEMPEPWEFDGVKVWHLDDADAWFCRHLRTEHSVTQRELADVLGVGQSGLSKWERGGGIPRYLAPKLRRIIEEIAATREEAA